MRHQRKNARILALTAIVCVCAVHEFYKDLEEGRRHTCIVFVSWTRTRLSKAPEMNNPVSIGYHATDETLY